MAATTPNTGSGAGLRLPLVTPGRAAAGFLLGLALLLTALEGPTAVAQTGVNGLALGAIYALGAVGLTLVYGILKLVNFAHGEFLTFGAYVAFAINVSLGLPLIIAALGAIAATAVLGLAFEVTLWDRCVGAAPGCSSSS